jgi:hypothetical protein
MAQARRPRHAGTAATAVDTAEGQDAAQDADRLPTLPRQHPQPATCQHAHAVVTGEPVAGTTGTAGSDRGPLEKDLQHRHLASGLPVRWGPPGGPSDSGATKTGALARSTGSFRCSRPCGVCVPEYQPAHRDLRSGREVRRIVGRLSSRGIPKGRRRPVRARSRRSAGPAGGCRRWP